MYTQFITFKLMVIEQGRRKMCLLCHKKPQIVTWARCVAYLSSEVKLIKCGPLCLMLKPLLYEAITKRVCTPIRIYSACIKCYIPLWRPHTVFTWQFFNEKEKGYPLWQFPSFLWSGTNITSIINRPYITRHKVLTALLLIQVFWNIVPPTDK